MATYQETINQSNPSAPSVYDVSIPDDELLGLIRRPFNESQAYWDKELKQVRQDNMSLWLPDHYKGMDIYDYQEAYLYVDNRIFTAIQTVTAAVNSRIPYPEINPAQDTEASMQVAKDMSKVITAYFQKYNIRDLFKTATFNMLLKRSAHIKLRWDPLIGKNGEIVAEHVMPEDIVVDKDTRWREIPRWRAEWIRGMTGDEMIAKWPDATQAIYKLMGCNRKDKSGNLVAYKTQLAEKKDVLEFWFSYYDEDEKKYVSSVCWTDKNFTTIIAKIKNPNWNYDKPKADQVQSMDGQPDTKDTDERENNFLDMPIPPYIDFGYLNDGSSFYDQTTMVEQAATLQRTLDRRGFQIGENAEMSGSGKIYNTTMIKKEEIAQLVGSPDESVGVNGDVRSAFMRMPPPQLANYVVEDKIDARNEIDNIFATHDVTRGEASNNKTLGQDRIQLGQDSTRMEEVSRAVERAATDFCRMYVQLAKVYYTEDHYFKAVGEDGQFDFVIMRSDLIQDGLDIFVKAGSMLPIDKVGQQKMISDLAQLGLVDPLTIFEVLQGEDAPSPKKMLERLLLFKTDPASMLQKVSDEDVDRNAFMDIQILLGAAIPKARDEYTPEYFNYFNKYMTGGDFLKQPPTIKQMFVEHLRMAQAQAQVQLQALQTQMPSPEEMQAANQQALGDAQMQGQMMSANPQANPQQPPQPGKPGQNPNSKPQVPPQSAPQGVPQGPPAPPPQEVM